MLTHETAPAEPSGRPSRFAAARRAIAWMSGPRALLAAIVVGLLVRVVAILVVDAGEVNLHEYGTIAHNVVDGHGYSYYAVAPDGRIEVDTPSGDGGWLSGERLPSAFVPPGYTAFVVAAVATGADHVGVVRLMQLLNLAVAVATAVLIHHLGRLLAGRTAGRAAAWVFALYPPLAFVTTQVSAANLYLLAQLATMLALVHAARRTRLAPTVVAGSALGVFCLFRSEAMLLVPLVAGWLIIARRRLRRGRAGAAAALLVAVALVLPGAWMARNNVVFDQPVLTVSTSGGFNLWIGNHDGATGSQKVYSTPERTREVLAAVPVTPDYEVTVDRIHLHEALAWITDDPLRAVLLDARKLAMLLTADVYDPRSLNPIYLGSWVLLLVLAVGGARAGRGRGPLTWLMYGLLAFAVAVPTLFFALARYRLGVEILLVPWAGAFLARLAAPAPCAARGPVHPTGGG